jgi:hypothetical protein
MCKDAGSFYRAHKQKNMKLNSKLWMITLALAALILSSCGSDPKGPSEEELFLDKLDHTWTLTTGQVTVDGVDVTESFAGMTLAFTSDKHYTTAHGVAPIWPAAGTFKLEKSSNSLYDIIRDDGMQIKVMALTDQSITLSLQYAYTGGRSGRVSGNYRFIMNR